jgi:hypothetical protein
MTCALLVGAALLSGCALPCSLGWDVASARDADEGYAVLVYVRDSGVIPGYADVARSQTGSRRFLKVVGVEDTAIQDEILKVAADARELYSTKPVVVTFFPGVVVRGRSGGSTYTGDDRVLRREIIP